jgi:flagellar biosynthesis protein FliR
MEGLQWIATLLYGPLWTFLCVISRIGPLMVMIPPLQGAAVPMRIKALVVLMIGAVITPVVMENSTPIPPHLFGLTVAIAKELMLGLMFGSVAAILVGSLHVGGQVISSLASMDVAQAADPMTEETVTVVSQLLSWLAMLLFLTLGGHRFVFAACVDSFQTYAAGGVLAEEKWLMYLHELVGHSMAVGLRAVGPPAVTLLLANFVTALIGRTLPQLNIMAIGFSLNITILLIALVFSISSIGWVFQNELGQWFDKISHIFPGRGA